VTLFLPKEYTWSSYRTYAWGKEDMLVDEHPVYLQLSVDEGERRGKYREFVRGRLKDKEAMKGEMNRRIIYGNKTFVQEMMAAHNISEKIRQVGRQKGWKKNKENRPL
jgi:putative transposase